MPEALFDYLTQMFPDLRVTWDSFEELSYDRTDIEQTLLQFLRARYFDGVLMPSSIPCRVFAGHRDDVLNLHTPEGRKRYESDIRALIPHAVVQYGDTDHFGRGPDRDPIIETMAEFCEQSETSGIHVPPMHVTPHYQGAHR